MAEVLGIGDLKAKFGMLRADMQAKTSRGMVVAGGQILKAEAKALALSYGFKKTGALIKNIVIKRETKGVPQGTTQYNLGVRHGKNLTRKAKKVGKRLVVNQGRIITRYADDPFYWRFLELKRKAGKRTIPGHSFIGKAPQTKGQAAIDAMGKRLQTDLDKAQR